MLHVLALAVGLGTIAPATGLAQNYEVPLSSHASAMQIERTLLDVPARLTVHQVTVGEGLRQLSRASGVPLAYSSTLIPGGLLTTCTCQDVTVEEALERMLGGTGLVFFEHRQQVLIEPFSMLRDAKPVVLASRGSDRQFVPNGASQRSIGHAAPEPVSVRRSLREGAIRGTVTDRESGRRLLGAQVLVVGTDRGTMTNQSGEYQIGNVPAGDVEVEVRMLGYRSERQIAAIATGAIVRLDFQLASEAIGLDEIIVTGTPGGQRRRELGSSMGVLGGSELEMAPIRDVQDVFFGRVAGVNLLANSGQPGAAGTLRLRGINSISQGNMPLIYVDGVRVSNSVVMAGARDAGVSQGVTPFNNINPEDIDRIEVVRGAAASTLYGTEASGGVIQIFTKRGSTGAAQWSAQVTTGVNQLGYVGPGNDDTGLWLKKCRGPELVNSEGVPFEDPSCPESGSWGSNGAIQQYSLSVQGGSGDMTYYLSGHFTDEQSPFPVGFDRPTRLRGNFGFRPLENLSLNVNAGYTKRTTRWIPDGSNASGFLMNVSRGNTGVYLDGDGNPHNEHGLVQRNHNWTDHFVSGLTASLDRGNITHRGTLGYDFFLTESETLYPFGNLHTPEGRMYKRNEVRASLTVEYVGSWRRRFGDPFVSTLSWGGQLTDENQRGQTMQGRYYAAPTEPDISGGAFSDVSRDSRLQIINAGFFAQNVFAIHDRAFLTAGIRIDGHSAFGRDFGLQPYPRLGLSYIISDHDFWPLPWMEELRLRAAVGDAGRAPGAFDAVETWQPVAGEDGSAGYSPNRLGNADLGPERTREYEAGFEARAFDGRFGVDLTYFHQDTYDALIPVRAPPSLGFSSAQLRNAGHLKNHGTEISVFGTPVRTRNLEWGTMLNVSTSFSKAVDLGGEIISIGERQSVREGYPVGAFIGIPVITNPNEFADPIIDEEGFLGPTQPTHTIGLRNEITFRQRATLEIMGEYQGGHYQQNGTGYQNANRGVWRPCYEAQQALRAAANGDPSALNNVTAQDRLKCAIDSSFAWHWWMQPADFFKLRSVALSYNLPTGVLPTGIGSASVRIAGRNLLTITDYDGIDPEVGDSGAMSEARRDYYTLPPYRTFTFSLRVNF